MDESGKPGGRGDEYFVVAGIALHEDDCYPFARSLDKLQSRFLRGPNARLELHASHMWAGRHDWARVPRRRRHGLLREIFGHLRDWRSRSGRNIILFGSAVHKRSFPANTLERAHEELFSRFDELLSRLHGQGESHRSVIVADESSYESLLQSLTPQWKRSGTRMGRLHSLVEVPLYVDSQASRIIQGADFAAWAIWQYYEHGHVEHIQKLNTRFDSDGGVQHGLAHLVRGYRFCSCVPCVSRRTRTIGRIIPPRP